MSKRSFHIVFFLLAFATLPGCIDPYDYPVEETANSLVVEAVISDRPGPHKVRLSTTRNIYNLNNEYRLYVTQARVSVTDDEGNSSDFREGSEGYYYSDSSFAVRVGRSYTLRIVTTEGKVYESTAETVSPTAEMTAVEASHALRSEKNEHGNFVNVDGFNVKAVVNDTPLERNFYLLRVNITYKVLTTPWAYEVFNPVSGVYVSAPKSCCSICWVNETIDEFAVLSDQLVDGQTDAELPLMFYPVNQKHFYEKVYFEVEQYSLSPKAYVFWKALHDLKFRQGTMFDPTPSALPGNIRNVADDNEQVIGYFTVSGTSAKGAFLRRDQVPGNVRYTFVFKDDCRKLLNGTTEEPTFWNEG